MELEHLSPSRIGTFDQCQGKYHAQYVEGLRGEPHPLTNMGSAVHLMYELATNTFMGKGACESVDPLYYQDFAYKEEKCDPSLIPLARELVDNGVDWGYFRNIDKCVGAEVKFEIALPDKTPVVGFIDRLDAWDDIGEVIDLKTQKRAFESATLHKNWQARVYNMAARHLVETIKGKVKVSFWVLRHQVQPVWLTSDDAKRTSDDLMAKADEIRSVKEPDFKPSGLCPWCPKHATCPAKKMGIKKRFNRKRS
jgi:RecB family exonuclease